MLERLIRVPSLMWMCRLACNPPIEAALNTGGNLQYFSITHLLSSSQIGRKGPFHIRMIQLSELVRQNFLIAQTRMILPETRHIAAKDGYNGVCTEKAS